MQLPDEYERMNIIINIQTMQDIMHQVHSPSDSFNKKSTKELREMHAALIIEYDKIF